VHPEIRINVPEFWEQGYLLIRNVFSKAEAEEFRSHGSANRQHRGDLLSQPYLRKALLDDRVLNIAAQILGDTPVYYGESTFNTGQFSFEFHRDNADRRDGNAPDWKGKYTQINFAFYLQDHAWHSGGLRIIPRSHNAVSTPSCKPRNVRTRVGDLVVWNLRTLHAGAATMLRLLPLTYVEPTGLALEKSHERPRTWYRYLVPVDKPVSMRIPRFLIAGEGPERAAMFFTMGREDAHMERFVSYLKTRTYAVERWKNSEYGRATWDAVQGKNIKVIDIGAEVRRRLAAGDTSLGLNKGHEVIPY